MVFAFVTFRSQEGLYLYLNAISDRGGNNSFKRFCKRVGRTLCCRSKTDLDTVKIDGKWPNPDISILPDNIFWENMSVGNVSRTVRAFFAFVVAFLILCASIAGILELHVVQG